LVSTHRGGVALADEVPPRLSTGGVIGESRVYRAVSESCGIIATIASVRPALAASVLACAARTARLVRTARAAARSAVNPPGWGLNADGNPTGARADASGSSAVGGVCPHAPIRSWSSDESFSSTFLCRSRITLRCCSTIARPRAVMATITVRRSAGSGFFCTKPSRARRPTSSLRVLCAPGNDCRSSVRLVGPRSSSARSRMPWCGVRSVSSQLDRMSRGITSAIWSIKALR
jgi:hypothetical protein